MRTFLSREFALFLVTGGVAAFINFGSRIVYDRWMSFAVAIVLGYCTGMLVAFVLARLLVFKGGMHSVPRSAAIFVAVNLAAVAQTWLVSMALAYYLLPALGITHHIPEIAHAFGVAVPVFTSYFGHKHWSFATAEEGRFT